MVDEIGSLTLPGETMTEREVHEHEEEKEITLLDYLHVLIKWRRPLVAFVAVCVGAAWLYSLRSPPVYEATATFLPFGANSTPGGGAEDFFRSLVVGAPSGPANLYPALARSQIVLDRVLGREFHSEEFGNNPHPLIQILGYGEELEPKERGEAYGTLRGMVRVEVDRTGTVNLTSATEEPRLSADLANAFVEELDSYNILAWSSRVRENRRFIENRLQETEAALAEAEDVYKQFRERNVYYANSPELTLREARLKREIAIQEQVYLTLIRQHELAKIEERRDAPSLDILNRAEVPAKPSRLRGRLNMVFAGVLSLTLGIFGVFILEYWRNLKHDREGGRLVQEWSGMFRRDYEEGKELVERGKGALEGMRNRLRKDPRFPPRGGPG